MPKMSLFGAVVTTLILSSAASAQRDSPTVAPDPGPADPMQGMMQGMHERMQAMHQMMHGMHGNVDGRGMQAMQGMHGGQQGGMEGMRGGAQGSAQAQSCIMRDPEGGLSALLTGPVAGLNLSESQRSELSEILARAQTEALAALTEDQRKALETAPPQTRATCSPM